MNTQYKLVTSMSTCLIVTLMNHEFWLTVIEPFSLKQMVTSATRITDKSKTLIDLIFMGDKTGCELGLAT